jgi:thiol-disulfide isomerase/thioredoxin
MRLALAVAIMVLSVLICALIPGSVTAPVLRVQDGSEVDLEGEITVLFFVTPGCGACKSMYRDIDDISKNSICVITVGVWYENESDTEFFSLV